MARAPGVTQTLILPPAPTLYNPADQNEVRRILQRLNENPPDFSAIISVPAPITKLGKATDFTAFATSWVEAANAAAARALLGVKFVRATVNVTTAALGSLVTENGSFTVPALLCALATITANDKAWVRLYTDAASRTADSARAHGTLPTAGTGVLAEFDFTAGGSQKIPTSPVP